MALALNNLKRVDMPLNKETKPLCHYIHFLITNKCKSLKVYTKNNKHHLLISSHESVKTGTNFARYSTIVKLVCCLVGFYGASNFEGYSTPNPFFIQIVLFQTIQFRMSTQFECKYSLIVIAIFISSYSV